MERPEEHEFDLRLTASERTALMQLLKTAENKGRSSPWWATLMAPLTGLTHRMGLPERIRAIKSVTVTPVVREVVP